MATGEPPKGQTLEVTVELPTCWADLLDIEEIDMETARAGDRDVHSADDPAAFYDDTRVICERFADGAVLSVFLSSGQTNYWLSYDLYRDGNCIVESEACHSLADGEVWEEGVYRVTVRLVDKLDAAQAE